MSSTTPNLNDTTDGPNNPPEIDEEDTKVVHEYIIKEDIIDNSEVVDDGDCRFKVEFKIQTQSELKLFSEPWFEKE